MCRPQVRCTKHPIPYQRTLDICDDACDECPETKPATLHVHMTLAYPTAGVGLSRVVRTTWARVDRSRRMMLEIPDGTSSGLAQTHPGLGELARTGAARMRAAVVQLGGDMRQWDKRTSNG